MLDRVECSRKIPVGPNGQPDKKSPMLPEEMRRLLDAELSRRGLGHFEVYQCGPTLDQAQIVSNYPEAMEPSDTADDFYRRGAVSYTHLTLPTKRIV